MKCHQVRPAVPLSKSAGHGSDNFFLVVVFHVSIAAEDPNNSCLLITLSQPLSVGFGIRPRENWLSTLVCVVPIPSPRWQKAKVHTARVCVFDNVIDVIPIIVVGAVFHRRPRRI